jgi:hypothetical protein
MSLGTFNRSAGQHEVAALESMEFGGTGLDAEAFGDDAPSFPPVGLVYVKDRIGRSVSHLALLEDHEGIRGGAYRADDRPHPGFRDAELGAHPGCKAVHVAPRLDIQVAQKVVEAPSGDRLAAKKQNRQ